MRPQQAQKAHMIKLIFVPFVAYLNHEIIVKRSPEVIGTTS